MSPTEWLPNVLNTLFGVQFSLNTLVKLNRQLGPSPTMTVDIIVLSNCPFPLVFLLLLFRLFGLLKNFSINITETSPLRSASCEDSLACQTFCHMKHPFRKHATCIAKRCHYLFQRLTSVPAWEPT